MKWRSIDNTFFQSQEVSLNNFFYTSLVYEFYDDKTNDRQDINLYRFKFYSERSTSASRIKIFKIFLRTLKTPRTGTNTSIQKEIQFSKIFLLFDIIAKKISTQQDYESLHIGKPLKFMWLESVNFTLTSYPILLI